MRQRLFESAARPAASGRRGRRLFRCVSAALPPWIGTAVDGRAAAVVSSADDADVGDGAVVDQVPDVLLSTAVTCIKEKLLWNHYITVLS